MKKNGGVEMGTLDISDPKTKKFSEFEIVEDYFENKFMDDFILKESYFIIVGKICLLQVIEDYLLISEHNSAAPFQKKLKFNSILNVHVENEKKFVVVVFTKYCTIQKLGVETDDHEVCKEWYNFLLSMIFAAEISQIKQRNLLVLCDKSLQDNFISKCVPIFHESRAKIEVKYHKNFVGLDKKIEMYLLQNIKKIHGIVAVGDDDLFSKIINVLLKHETLKNYIHIPVGIISSSFSNKNGMASSFRVDNPLVSTFCIAKGFYKSFDICSIYQNAKKSYFVSQLFWGVRAELYLNSDNHSIVKNITLLRNLLKFKLLGGKIYLPDDYKKKKKVVDEKKRFSPFDPFEKKPTEINSVKTLYPRLYGSIMKEKIKIGERENFILLNDAFFDFACTSATHYSIRDCISPKSKLNDGLLEIQILKNVHDKTKLVWNNWHKLEQMDKYSVSSFGLAPRDGTLLVDNVKFPLEPFLVECHRNMGNRFTLD